MGLSLRLRGSVQGVGFRPWLWRTAQELGVRGRVSNARDGVRIQAFGPEEALESLSVLLANPPLPGVRVESVEVSRIGGLGPAGFSIVESSCSDAAGRVDVSLGPDLPTCPQCLGELSDPHSRRHRYAFVACAHCGPRYSASRELPYDRVRTAMADFPLCAECSREYAWPEDRRFHAEATACPSCGPSIRCRLVASDTVDTVGEQALERAIDVLRSGGIVAVQGIGGFHLACDASDEQAVVLLRGRKQRPSKPLAVMVRTQAEAEKHALLGAEERELLGSEARPIVLLRRRADSDLAPSLAPGSPMLGLLLGYTPLHELLLAGFGGPLVMTSANRSGEPIVYLQAHCQHTRCQQGHDQQAHYPQAHYARSDDADDALVELADAVLSHDREIVAPCDDSVACSAPSGPILLRRSRGHVPRPIRLARPLRHTVLACGGQWNNTLCVAHGDSAWLSAHVGDVESPASVARLEETARRWLDWLQLEPQVVAHDLHPRYESTRFAHTFESARLIGVQHHHAHMAAVLAEHGHEGPALALTWDGTGAGVDGTAWGGELLYGSFASVERIATLRPIRLAGGEHAIREPWRLALALLDDSFDGDAPHEALRLFAHVRPLDRERVHALLASPALCPAAHGVGRYFDAIGALLLERPVVGHSGELAQGLNFLASGRPADPYVFDFDLSSRPWTIDLRPCVRALVADLLGGRSHAEIADRFHATLVSAGSAAVRAALEANSLARGLAGTQKPCVVLAGGCFQNALLVDGLECALGQDFEVLRPQAVPPGDGGLALGQALVADALASIVRED